MATAKKEKKTKSFKPTRLRLLPISDSRQLLWLEFFFNALGWDAYSPTEAANVADVSLKRFEERWGKVN